MVQSVTIVIKMKVAGLIARDNWKKVGRTKKNIDTGGIWTRAHIRRPEYP